MLNSTKNFKASIVAVLCAVFFISAASAETPLATFSSSKNTVKLEVAQTPEEIQHGLMYRTSMPEDNGMVFLFHPIRPTRFWMYHTLIALDMLFIKDGKIARICENVPPCRSEDPHNCALYPEEGDIAVSEVLELNGGYCKRHGIKQGDTIKFEL